MTVSKKKGKLFAILYLMILLTACSDDSEDMAPVSPTHDTPPSEEQQEEEENALSDEELLDLTQSETFKYFFDFAEENSGAARERIIVSSPQADENLVATGGTGFGLMNLVLGIERGFISRSEGISRISSILNFYQNADRFHGAWPHWLDGRTGAVIPFSELDDGGDLVETALFVQGLTTVEEYLKNGSDEEQGLAIQAATLAEGVEWNWYTQGENVLYWHWSPDNGFAINLQISGYNEGMLPYIFAAGSENFGISPEVFTSGWERNGGILSNQISYDIPLVVDHPEDQINGGPLFLSQYSYLGLDPRNLASAAVDYGTAAVNHARINYAYCVDNPIGFRDYGEDLWGITASYTRNDDGSLGYVAHSPSFDRGVIAPTAALSSFPYTPEESMRALRYFYDNRAQLLGDAGFFDAFSPTFNFWVARAYLAIDQGPIAIMIENHRTQLFWNLFMENERVLTGLDNLGFTF